MPKNDNNETDATPEPPLCFVIGPIGDTGSATRKHADMLLNAIIKPVLQTLGYRVRRADEDPTPGMISPAVIRDIRDAKLVIADLSELNPNAFYELGIRHARMAPTIHMVAVGVRLPFDNQDYRAIRFDLSDWQSHKTAQLELGSAVTATQAKGFVVSNPITHANAIFDISENRDSQSSMIADLFDRLTALESAWPPTPRSPPRFAARFLDGLVARLESRFSEMGSSVSSNDKLEYAKRFLADEDIFVQFGKVYENEMLLVTNVGGYVVRLNG
jgi:hypothetical protein